jgi:hypothetical protein
MYGVPADLPLDKFVGSEICQIQIGRFQINFVLAGRGVITVMGRWELKDRSGNLIDSEVEHAERDCYRAHQIIDVPIEAFAIDPPRSFTLNFKSGHVLEIYDDSEQYESFWINFGANDTFYI